MFERGKLSLIHTGSSKSCHRRPCRALLYALISWYKYTQAHLRPSYMNRHSAVTSPDCSLVRILSNLTSKACFVLLPLQINPAQHIFFLSFTPVHVQSLSEVFIWSFWGLSRPDVIRHDLWNYRFCLFFSWLWWIHNYANVQSAAAQSVPAHVPPVLSHKSLIILQHEEDRRPWFLLWA